MMKILNTLMSKCVNGKPECKYRPTYHVDIIYVIHRTNHVNPAVHIVYCYDKYDIVSIKHLSIYHFPAGRQW